MLLTLVKKQFQSFFYHLLRRDGKHSKLSSFGFGILFIYLFGMMALLSFGMMNALCEVLLQSDMGWFYFVYAFFISFGYAVMGSVFSAKSGLYEARDNELLLSLPIPAVDILISRMLPLYFLSFLFEAIVLIPSFLVYGMYAGEFGLRVNVITSVILVFVLPLLPLVISCILGWLLSKVSSKIKHKNLVSIVISLLFMFGYIYFVSKLNAIMQQAILIAMSVGTALNKYSWLVRIGEAGLGIFSSFVMVVVIILVIFVICCYILERTYLKVMTTQHGSIKSKYKKEQLHSVSVDQALLIKEWRKLSSSTMYLMNTCMGTIFLLIGIVVMLVRSSYVKEMIATMYPVLGDYMPLMVCASLMSLASMNTVSAPSISVEGKSMWQLQVLPVSKMQILMAKLKLHVLVSAPAIFVFSLLVNLFLETKLFEMVLMVIIPVVFVVVCGEAGLFFNLLKPRLDYETETAAVKQNISVLLSMFAPFTLVMGLAGLYILVFINQSVLLYLVLCLAIEVGIGLGLYQWLKTTGCKILETLG